MRLLVGLVLEPKALLRLELLLLDVRDREEVDLPEELVADLLTDCWDELLDLLDELTDLLAERTDFAILEDLFCRDELPAVLEDRADFEIEDLLWLEELFDPDARLAADTKLWWAVVVLMKNRPTAIPARISQFRN